MKASNDDYQPVFTDVPTHFVQSNAAILGWGTIVIFFVFLHKFLSDFVCEKGSYKIPTNNVNRYKKNDWKYFHPNNFFSLFSYLFEFDLYILQFTRIILISIIVNIYYMEFNYNQILLSTKNIYPNFSVNANERFPHFSYSL